MSWTRSLVALVALFMLGGVAHAEQVRNVVDTDVWSQAGSFFRFESGTVRGAVIGCILLGAICGLLGSFVVVRRMALVGDMLSHAVLPGIAMGFLWDLTRNPVHLFVGAVIVGLIGAGMVNLIRQTTRLKQDAALGIVLVGFFAIGLIMLNLIERVPSSSKSGLEQFLWGNAAAITGADLKIIACVAAVVVVSLGLFYQQFVATSFDPGFSRSIGIPVQVFNYGLTLLLVFAIVVGLRAAGVVLVSALLIIPASAAYLLTDRMHWMLVISSGFGSVAAFVGVFVSALAPGLPTGPYIALASGAIFAAAFLFSPKYGVLRRWLRSRSRQLRVGRENTLKAIYHVLERGGFSTKTISLQALADRRRLPLDEVAREVTTLQAYDLAEAGDGVLLTKKGWKRAQEIVRNHRLWELYLTRQAEIATDHVHEDAEKIEHVLGESVVRAIESELNLPAQDPHGQEIPDPVKNPEQPARG